MKVCYVLADAYSWSTPIEGRPDRRDYHTARKGDRIELSDEEAARGLALAAEGNGGLSLEAADVEAAVAASTEPPSWSDEQLDSASRDDTVAYLAQHPSEAGRIAAREASREDRKLKVRKTILEAAERTQAAYDDEVEAAALARADAEDEEQRAYAASAGGTPPAPRIPA